MSVSSRRGAFLAAPALYCGGCGALLPGANHHYGVDYWRPVRQMLAAVLACSWLALGLCLALTLWDAAETNILSQSAVNSMQIGQAVPEAQEKPLVSFI